MKSRPPIYFYIPPHRWPSSFNIAELDANNFMHGAYAWTFNTYYYLNQAGFPCSLVSEIPNEGIVFAYRKSFVTNLKPSYKRFLVCIKGDESWHPYAQLHVVQNTIELTSRYKVYGKRYFIPIWPQPGLIPRSSNRNNQFENIAYFGRENNLAAELRSSSWRNALSEEGFNFIINSTPETWRDYSYVDAVVAVRVLGKNKSFYNWKPPTKLYQAWHAGVPAILGVETAYQSEMRSELDYIEVSSLEELLNALRTLRDDIGLRNRIIDNGRKRAQETSVEQLVKLWKMFIDDVVINEYQRWCSRSRISRSIFIMSRSPTTLLMRMVTKLFKS